MESQLDRAIEKYVLPLGEKYGFSPVKRQCTGMGALQDYIAGNLYIRIVNDRGIIDFEVAPLNHPDRLCDLTLIREYLNPPARGVLNLSLQQQAEFMDSHWDWLTEVLSEPGCADTWKALREAGRRRSRRMFGE